VCDGALRDALADAGDGPGPIAQGLHVAPRPNTTPSSNRSHLLVGGVLLDSNAAFLYGVNLDCLISRRSSRDTFITKRKRAPSGALSPFDRRIDYCVVCIPSGH
jgi:hypothetical protein